MMVGDNDTQVSELGPSDPSYYYMWRPICSDFVVFVVSVAY